MAERARQEEGGALRRAGQERTRCPASPLAAMLANPDLEALVAAVAARPAANSSRSPRLPRLRPPASSRRPPPALSGLSLARPHPHPSAADAREQREREARAAAASSGAAASTEEQGGGDGLLAGRHADGGGVGEGGG